MKNETFLLRQVNPSFIQEGRVTSQVFRPTPKDENMLSAYNGDRISPEEAWRHFTGSPENRSAGVMAVTWQECRLQELPVIEDGTPFPEHVSIDFRGKTKSATEKKAKLLRTNAEKRGWLYRVEVVA